MTVTDEQLASIERLAEAAGSQAADVELRPTLVLDLVAELRQLRAIGHAVEALHAHAGWLDLTRCEVDDDGRETPARWEGSFDLHQRYGPEPTLGALLIRAAADVTRKRSGT